MINKSARLSRELVLAKEQRRIAETKALEAQEQMFAAQMIGSAGEAMQELQESREKAHKARVAVQIANVATVMGLDVGSISMVALRVWKHNLKNSVKKAAEEEQEKVVWSDYQYTSSVSMLRCTAGMAAGPEAWTGQNELSHWCGKITLFCKALSRCFPFRLNPAACTSIYTSHVPHKGFTPSEAV